MTKLKVGVIGTGKMGRNHVRNYADEIGRFELVGVYDENNQTAKKVAQQFNTRAFKDMSELLDEVDAVSVVVPSSLHKEVGTVVAEHKVHALIEKPLALNSKDAEYLTDLFRSRELYLQVGHIERFNPVILELDKLLNKKQVFYIEAHRYSPFSGSGRITDTSVVEDLMIHDIDLVCHLMDPYKVTDIRANGERIRSDHIDFATAMLDFEDHAHAVINASRVSQGKERSIVIHTEDSFIEADLLARTLMISKNTDMIVDLSGDSSYKQDGIVQKIFVPIKEPLRQELIAFYNTIVDGEPIAVTGETGTNAVKLCEDIVGRINDR